MGYFIKIKATCFFFVTAYLALGAFVLSAAPKTSSPKILRVLPHHSGAFTQGLLVANDTLVEGSGLYNQSGIFLINTGNGEIEHSISTKPYFGEGIALMENRLVQLTWKAGLALVYEYPSLKKIKEYKYIGEGWGLTSEGNKFYMSNGSNSIYIRDSLFNVIRSISVTLDGNPQNNLNELEMVKGKLYANIWYQPIIIKINPKNGEVESVYDCRNLFSIEKPKNRDHVLNGIAYNPSSQTFYLTGKNWKNIFEVVFPDG